MESASSAPDVAPEKMPAQKSDAAAQQDGAGEGEVKEAEEKQDNAEHPKNSMETQS